MYVSSAPCGNSTIRKWAAPTFGERYSGLGWPGCWHAEMERAGKVAKGDDGEGDQGDREQEDGGKSNNISSSGDVESEREARKEARREKQRARKLARAAKSPDPPKWIEKSRSVHEGVALSKGADSFRWGIRKFVFFLGFPFQNENLENLK